MIKATAFFIGTLIVSLFLVFSSGMPQSEPHVILPNGWKVVIFDYLLLSGITVLIIKYLGAKTSTKLYLAMGLLWAFFAFLSIIFSFLVFARPRYLPEILIVPIANSIYLYFSYKMYIKFKLKK